MISTACAKPLGLENGHLHTDYLSGSSGKDRWNFIKLHHDNPWYSKPHRDKREYLQVVVTPYGRTVTALAVESHSFMVTSFTLKTSEDGVDWYDYIVHGNIEVRCFLQVHCNCKTFKTHLSLLKVTIAFKLLAWILQHP